MVDVSYLILQAIVAFSICHGYNDVDEQHSFIITHNDTIQRTISFAVIKFYLT